MAESVSRTSRGTTTIHPRVLDSVATTAALTVPGCIRHSSGLGRLTGRSLPAVEVRSLNTAVDAQVHIAVEWPCAVNDVASAVRRAVTEHLAAVTGIPVIRVDVHVGAVVPVPRPLADTEFPLPVPLTSAIPELRAPKVTRPANVRSPAAPVVIEPMHPRSPASGLSSPRRTGPAR